MENRAPSKRKLIGHQPPPQVGQRPGQGIVTSAASSASQELACLHISAWLGLTVELMPTLVTRMIVGVLRCLGAARLSNRAAAGLLFASADPV
ncbi:hypothetical protein [Sorangium sp. So ce1153]|uniref:hypothetical protein n=1 Tax=Sorangium sp. So ce1153 TaxID=3133333 RepID=UPI003F5F65E1